MENNSKRRSSRRPKKSYNRGNRRKKGLGFDLQEFIGTSRKQSQKTIVEQRKSFKDLDIDPEVFENIKHQGFSEPTEIQERAIPIIKDGTDIVGIAGTGTGKTGAFLIPIIESLVANPKTDNILIVTPTRELASQVYDEFRKLSRGLNLYASTLIGGIPIGQSIKALKRKNHIIIGTPGRLIDMYERRFLRFDRFDKLVLDEFDRMLDMGFLGDVKIINDAMIHKKQTLLFSATMEKSQREAVDYVTNNPTEITAKVSTAFTKAIDQSVLRVSQGNSKMKMVEDLITETPDDKVVIFCETKRQVENIHKQLKSTEIRSVMMHGDRSQSKRETALKHFKTGQSKVLVATDVASRGIDVADISLVINLEVPRTLNDYIHRIGRTGRAGKSGRAVTMMG